MEEQRQMDYNRRFNARTGALVGLVGGLLASGVALIAEPELRQMPLEDIIIGTGLATVGTTAATSAAGYINQRVILPVMDYISRVTNRYFYGDNSSGQK